MPLVRPAKSLAKAVLAMASGLTTQFMRGPVILYFHGVVEEIDDPWIQDIHADVKAFEALLNRLGKHYEFLSLADVADNLDTLHKLPRNAIVVTFDDGYRNNLTVAQPILDRRGIPLSVFVSTRHISTGCRFPFYRTRLAIRFTRQDRITLPQGVFDLSNEEVRRLSGVRLERLVKSVPRHEVTQIVEDLEALLPPDQWKELDERFDSDAPMSWSEVKTLADRGVIIGSHCHDHCILHARQSPEEIESQVRQSKALIEQHLGGCRYFAYPNGEPGDITTDAVAAVERAGYALAVTAIPGRLELARRSVALPRVHHSPHIASTLPFLPWIADRRFEAWQGALAL